jgi:hypothetical protein
MLRPISNVLCLCLITESDSYIQFLAKILCIIWCVCVLTSVCVLYTKTYFSLKNSVFGNALVLPCDEPTAIDWNILRKQYQLPYALLSRDSVHCPFVSIKPTVLFLARSKLHFFLCRTYSSGCVWGYNFLPSCLNFIRQCCVMNVLGFSSMTSLFFVEVELVSEKAF